MNSIEALWQAIIGSLVSSRPLKPGVVITSMPKEYREALEKLTSDDALNMRYIGK